MGSKIKRYMEAKTMIKRDQVQMVVCRLDPIDPLLLFELKEGMVRVSYNRKGWLSDWTESLQDYAVRCAKAKREGRDRPQRSSSVFLVGKEDDAYILACKLLLKQKDIPVDAKGDPLLEEKMESEEETMQCPHCKVEAEVCCFTYLKADFNGIKEGDKDDKDCYECHVCSQEFGHNDR